ncbi:C-C chemokine receptor type 2-like isoform X2 [Hydractinia symbiolongicarpus]|uniref:C-C chemokine receptor type 2-like isoform X2 n=1 Tax=Hydractinia symbiolongicarpus TaxID=13093 RepID=UPI00254A8CB4|nr:C-C chemokine receptor type 2-like isoform X2 [Hydractinia symbiolongicarpus]
MGMMNSPNKTSNYTHGSAHEFFSPSFIISVLFLYALLLAFGIIGNLLTLMVVVINKSMRRSIHFYTFNLAVADSIILIFYIPTQMKVVFDQLLWNMGKNLCLVTSCIIPLCLSASIFTLIAISIDRYRGFKDPFKWRANSQRYAKFTIPFIWILSSSTAFPVIYYADLYADDDVSFCVEVWPSTKAELAYWSFIMSIQYIIPLIFIAAVHIYMAWGVAQRVSLQASVNPFIYGTTRNDYKLAFKRLMKYAFLTTSSCISKRAVGSTEYAIADTVSTDIGTTPNFYRKTIVQKTVQQEYLMPVPYFAYQQVAESINETDISEEEKQKLRSQRLDTLAFLDLDEFQRQQKLIKIKKKRNWRKTFTAFLHKDNNSPISTEINNAAPAIVITTAENTPLTIDIEEDNSSDITEDEIDTLKNITVLESNQLNFILDQSKESTL